MPCPCPLSLGWQWHPPVGGRRGADGANGCRGLAGAADSGLSHAHPLVTAAALTPEPGLGSCSPRPLIVQIDRFIPVWGDGLKAIAVALAVPSTEPLVCFVPPMQTLQGGWRDIEKQACFSRTLLETCKGRHSVQMAFAAHKPAALRHAFRHVHLEEVLLRGRAEGCALASRSAIRSARQTFQTVAELHF